MEHNTGMYITGDRGGRIEAFENNRFLNELCRKENRQRMQ